MRVWTTNPTLYKTTADKLKGQQTVRKMIFIKVIENK